MGLFFTGDCSPNSGRAVVVVGNLMKDIVAFSISGGLLLTLAAAWGGAADAPARSATAADRYAEAAALVRKLGDERFATRELATTQLIQMGLAAHRALEEGRRQADREIRFRCERILSIVEDMDFQRRLAAFVAGRSGEECGLPCWRRFREAFGGEAEARALFVEMQKAEYKLLEAVERGPEGVAKLAELRCVTLQQSQNTARQVPLGSVVALLFAGTTADVTLPMQAQNALSSFCYQQAVIEAMNDAGKAKLLRPLLGAWVKCGEGWAAQQNMSLAIRYDLKEGLVPAIKVIQAQGNQPYLRMQGVMTVVKLGDSSHLALLESLLEDTAKCSVQRVNNVQFETQIRDVALAAILVMKKQDPKQFGFDRFQDVPQSGINVSTVGFENDEKRNQALAKWREFKKQEKK
jgi:hypothetical protein